MSKLFTCSGSELADKLVQTSLSNGCGLVSQMTRRYLMDGQIDSTIEKAIDRYIPNWSNDIKQQLNSIDVYV